MNVAPYETKQDATSDGVPAADVLADDVLVVIPSVNGGALLRRMLPTMRFPMRNVMVLDQGSDDDTEALCREHGAVFRQLGRPHTYTEACNIGAAAARGRGVAFVLIANNDITFRTDVIGQLRAEMGRDPHLGIVAPSQVVIDEEGGRRLFTSRVYWNLDHVEFLHDVAIPGRDVRRLEADFCELTCALVRLAAADAVGFLDDAFGFYHEDADFGLRLRQAGWSCAYLPGAQIDHFSSSTFSREMSARKKEYLSRNRKYFTAKHLGYGVRPSLPTSAIGGAWDGFGCDLAPALLRHGLVEVTAPELVMAAPGVDTAGYCYTDYAAPALPPRWARHRGRYKAVLTAAAPMRDRFAAEGFAPAFHVPPGIEPDVFHPWGPSRRAFAEPVVLAFAHGWQACWLSELLAAWRAARAPGWLLVSGQGLTGALGGTPDSFVDTGAADVSRFGAERIELHDGRVPLSAAALAEFLRGVDAVVHDGSDPALRLPLLRAMACGVPVLCPPDDLLADLRPAGAPTWAPGGLAAALADTLRRSPAERDALGEAALYRVRSAFTLRHTVWALRGALSALQVRDPAEALARVRQRLVTEGLSVAEPVPAPRGGGTGRRVAAAGRLLSTFGDAWSEKGFAVARDTVRNELRFFLRNRRGAAAAEAPAVPAPVPAASPGPTASPGAPPVAGSALLIGYIDAQLGLGQSMRGLARAMDAAACPFRILPVGLGVEGRRGAPFMPERNDLLGVHAVNVLEVTATELPRVRAHVGEYHFERSYNVLRTYWELSRAPAAWKPHLAGIHEIWAPTSFVADSFRTIFAGPITVVPPAIEEAAPAPGGRAEFGLDPDRFLFLFSFDYYSFPQRKNPLAAIAAFARAFPDPREAVGLVVKSTGAADHYPEVRQELRQAARLDGRITVIDESLAPEEMRALQQATDCYVSLHRAEGFGLGMAEAMLLGKPVIGTDYSGNTDFLTPETGFPVPFKLRPVAADEYVFAEGQVWADPDVRECAAALRRVVDDPALRRDRAEAGQRFIRDHLGPAPVGALVKARLAAIAANGRPAGTGTSGS